MGEVSMFEKVKIIVAWGQYVPGKGYPIGKGGKMPWHNAKDLAWFKEETTGHCVIMGRKTFESIGKSLPNRCNIVITRNPSSLSSVDGISIVDSLEQAIEMAKKNQPGNDIFIIGGASIYKEALDKNLVDEVMADMLSEKCDNADTFFPELSSGTWETNEPAIEIEHRKAYVVKFTPKKIMNSVDRQYSELLKKIIDEGTVKQTRSGSVRAIFDATMRFSLREGLPLITTKKVYYKGIIHELLWFLSGSTNIKYLVENKVHIWDDDAYRFYLEQKIDKIPLDKEKFIEKVLMSRTVPDKDYTFGDLGPIYSKQWRNWGSKDQIADIIKKLKHSPDDRRIVLSAWNVSDIDKMALPPCHMMAIFNTRELPVEEREKMLREQYPEILSGEIVNEEYLNEIGFPKRILNCSFIMRSNDFCTGNPYNIAQYGMLTYMLCEVCNMIPGELVYHGIDVHVYENHIENAKEQLKRKGSGIIPKLGFKRHIKNIDDFKYDDFEILNYFPDSPIKYQLNVG